MRSLGIGCVALALLLSSMPVVAQQPMAGGVTVTPTTVTRVILVDVKPGQRPAFDRDVMDNLIPVWEEYKKAGILTDYEIFSNQTLSAPGDWDVGVALTYPNWATFDNFAGRTDPITLKHYGTAEKRTAAAMARTERGTTVSSQLIRTLRYSR